jgi:hypothetical protein
MCCPPLPRKPLRGKVWSRHELYGTGNAIHQDHLGSHPMAGTSSGKPHWAS